MVSCVSSHKRGSNINKCLRASWQAGCREGFQEGHLNFLSPSCSFVGLEIGDPLDECRAEGDVVKVKKDRTEAAQSLGTGLVKWEAGWTSAS